MNAYSVVDQFERRVAAFAGAAHAVAVESCTAALFLAMYVRKGFDYVPHTGVKIPMRTYVSVPMAALQAGFDVELKEMPWKGAYPIGDIGVIDGAKRFRRGMYMGGLHCLSFHAKKHIAIGRGGMILTSNPEHASLLKKLRYDGREGKPYGEEEISVLGWNMYMTPEQAARGLMLMDIMPSRDGFDDLTEDYPPLTKHPIFRNHPRVRWES